MNIAIMGVRGLPLGNLSFGGFEAFVAGLAPRLVRAGHKVTVYCRSDLYRRRPAQFDGVRLRYVASINHKVFGTPLHMTLCSVEALFRRYDAILVMNSGNGLQCGVLRLASNARLVLNMDGVEWERGKWGRFGRAYFKLASRLGARFVHVAVADSRAIGDLYRRLFGIETSFIPYAVDVYDSPEDGKVRALGLGPKNYALVVGRLIPENCTDVLIEGFRASLPQERLVVVGGSNYESPFHHRLRALGEEGVTFVGHVHDQDLLWQLFRHSRIYLHGHSVGGTSPGLLQALAAGCCIGAHDVVFNREVIADAGQFFRPTKDSIGRVARTLWDLPEQAATVLRHEAQKRIKEGGYSWSRVVAAYETALSAVAEPVRRVWQAG